MSIKKIIAFAAAAVIAAGICTGVPTDIASDSILTVAAETEDGDFVIETDENGDEYISGYTGNGGDINIPNGVKAVKNAAFAGNNKITSVTLPKTCNYIGQNTFSECANLKKIVFEGDITIERYAFYLCINLESVVIKGSIKEIVGASAFGCCQSLKKVTILENNYDFTIGGEAFINCFSLSSINIPSKCTTIYGNAFLNCFNLEKLAIPSKTTISELGGDYTFGYAKLYKTQKEFEDFILYSAAEPFYCVSDEKITGYFECYLPIGEGYYPLGDDSNCCSLGVKKYTPKQLTLIVTKGSSAETWAKANGVKYAYTSSTGAAAPTNFKASKTDNSITLSWDKVDGADAYRVYKYNDKTGKYEKYKDVANEKCKVTGLKSNTEYKFVVTVYNKADGKYVKGKSSKAVSVTTKQ